MLSVQAGRVICREMLKITEPIHNRVSIKAQNIFIYVCLAITLGLWEIRTRVILQKVVLVALEADILQR